MESEEFKDVDSEDEQLAIYAFDDDAATKWNYGWRSPTPHPHEIQIDLGKEYNIHEFRVNTVNKSDFIDLHQN